MVIEESSIPLKFFRGLDGMSLAKQSLYRALRENYGARVESRSPVPAIVATGMADYIVVSITRLIYPGHEMTDAFSEVASSSNDFISLPLV
jgi:hypothetical protein